MKDYIMFLFAVLLTIMTIITVGCVIGWVITWLRDRHWRWRK